MVRGPGWGVQRDTCSCGCSSRLVSAAFPPGHFSHVFIDECGHAVEPESVTAVAGEWRQVPLSSSAASPRSQHPCLGSSGRTRDIWEPALGRAVPPLPPPSSAQVC